MRVICLTVLGGLLLMGTANAALYEPAGEPFIEMAAAGEPHAQIVTSAEPTYLEQFAASELQSYFQRMSGAELPIVKEGEDVPHPYSFFIGETEKNLSRAIEISEETVGRDGFVLHSIPGGLCIFGSDELSPLFGVYELLERYFEVRWFMPGEIGEHLPQRETLRMGQVELVYKPSFRVRWVGNGEWPLRQRMNAYVKAGDRDVGINWKWHFHTFRILIPPEKYHAEHPEYFALVNGERKVTDSKSHGNQLCTSNPDVIREVGENMIAVLDEDPSIEIITLSPNDGGGFCECENCTALDEPERDWFAKYSRRLAIFNNEVAKIVKQKHRMCSSRSAPTPCMRARRWMRTTSPRTTSSSSFATSTSATITRWAAACARRATPMSPAASSSPTRSSRRSWISGSSCHRTCSCTSTTRSAGPQRPVCPGRWCTRSALTSRTIATAGWRASTPSLAGTSGIGWG